MMRSLPMRFVAIAGFAFALAGCSTMASRQAAADRLLEDRLSSHIEYLASDELEGRFPGTAGAKKTIAYQIEKMKEYGFGPGYIGEYTQPVTLTKTSISNVMLTAGEGDQAITISGEDVQLLGPTPSDAPAQVSIIAISPDIETMPDNLDGKFLMLFDPPPGSDLFRRALETDAAALIIVVDDEDRMKRVRRAAGRANYELDTADGDGSPLFYIAAAEVEKLFEAQANSMDDAQEQASEAGGYYELPFAIGVEATANREVIQSANVLGVLPGKKPGSGAVMLLAHWDHTGLCRPEGAEDRICNGAADNASGIAVMLEVGRIIAEGPALDRDVYLMGNTAEELGLLGATAFANNPPVPASDFVATFSMDTLAIAGSDAPLTIVGKGTTPLDAGIMAVGERLGRTFDIKDEHQQFTRRHDGAALMRVGIPSVVVGSSFGDQEKMDAFFANRYHQPSDEFDEGFEMGGMLSDMPLYVELLRHFGSTDHYMPPEPENEVDISAEDSAK